MFDGFVKKIQWHRMYPFCNGSDKAPLVKYWFDIVRLVPMCLGPPSRGHSTLGESTKTVSCICNSNIQDIWTPPREDKGPSRWIHKAVSCICNSNIQGCSTLGDLHPVLTISTSSPPSPHVLEFTENSCNVICTNKYPYMFDIFWNVSVRLVKWSHSPNHNEKLKEVLKYEKI